MSSIIIPEDSVIKAMKDSQAVNKSLLVDFNGKPISAKEYDEPEREVKRKFCVPIGADYRYYKINTNDKTYVGYVKNRKIPKNAISISAQSAFEIMYGYKEAHEGTNHEQWKKISKTEAGAVMIENTEMRDLPNPNNESFLQVEKQQEFYNA